MADRVSPAAPFDPVAAWQALTPERQEAIGVAAIIHTLGVLGADSDSGSARAFEAAEVEGLNALVNEVDGLLSGAAPARPDLSALGITACRVCGCTDSCACKGGCSWVEPDLCSACADGAARPEKETPA